MKDFELEILNKIYKRFNIVVPEKDEVKSQYFIVGNYTLCLIRSEDLNKDIVGIGITKRNPIDIPNNNIATNISFARAARDYVYRKHNEKGIIKPKFVLDNLISVPIYAK